LFFLVAGGLQAAGRRGAATKEEACRENSRLHGDTLGKKNDGAFGSSVEPLCRSTTRSAWEFVPNNAVIIHEDAVALKARVMTERITHTTSECTLRGFTCSQAKVDPKAATPAEISRMRQLAIGHQIKGLTGGLIAK
jgi:hypothetical protein